MRSSLHVIFVLAINLCLVWGDPARNLRQLEEGSGDDSGEKGVTEIVDVETDEESNVKTNQDDESDSPDYTDLHENEVEIDSLTEDESLANAEKKDNAKCEKCLKPSWRGRHSIICDSCEKKGVIKPIVEEDEKHIEKCKKCTRRKFKARHSIFCGDCPVADLYEEEENVKSEKKKHNKVVHNKTNKAKLKPAKEEKEDEEETGTGDRDLNKKTKKKDHKNKNKKQAEAEKSKDNKMTEDKEKHKHKNQHKNKKNKNKNNKGNKKNTNKNQEKPKKESTAIKFATTSIEEEITPVKPAETNLGPLGSLIKYLVKANTFMN